MGEEMTTETLRRELSSRFPSGISAVEPFAGTLGHVRFDPGIVLELLRELRDRLGFEHLAMVAGTDWVDHREVLYTLWSDRWRGYLLLSAVLSGEHPHIESATALWPSAAWHEREAWEFVDITFDHHPDLRNLLLPTGYTFHPLLRSFKLHEPEELEVKVRDV